MAFTLKRLVPHIISIITNAITSIMIIVYNSESSTYCSQTYPDISTIFATFDCTGSDLSACINDDRCYNPKDTFGFGFCMDECECCQSKLIHNTFTASIIFLVFVGILLMSIVGCSQSNVLCSGFCEKCAAIASNVLGSIINIAYCVISLVVISRDISYIIVVIINAILLIYNAYTIYTFNKKASNETSDNPPNSSDLYNSNLYKIKPESNILNANDPPPRYTPSYNEVAPLYNTNNGTEEIIAWFKQCINLPIVDIDYNDKYYNIFIENGFDTFNGIKAITNQDLIDMNIDKLGHRKQIMIAINKLNNNAPGDANNAVNEGEGTYV